LAIPEDSSAKITAAGLLGDNFIAIEPGASDYMLAEGDRIQYTQGSVNLLDMAGKLIHGSADGGE
jgi:phospholipid/cholesterol/gamma-HCH transport system substrate-binding protein